MASESVIDPIHQFHILKIVDLGEPGGVQLAFTNSAAFMFGIVALIFFFLTFATRGRTLVPGRLQSMAEMSYEFVASMVRSTAGNEGMKFFPLVFSLFMFVLVANFIGMIPYGFTVTSHLIVTAMLALVVILTVIIYGFMRHGTHFLGLFVPSGVPAFLLPFMVVIEVISFLSRPISLSLRLFANMLAGHIAMKVFAGFIVMMSASGFLGLLGGTLPLAMVIALTALEFLVAALQAYVFAVLTCIYLNDALHPGH
ncbi:F0F1 ATP synthase subunit A [Ancylobacter mangrovi]|uniref:ATP synthase subunit a n=1 Tax=Ancylobacter mangrovi TaxID=2972472 RepID=A0A9X2T1S1_9HYPH|nr:F0F1 ATP synthase subunit A [Ancylobacter mangrovi]MCS0495380.1 F0F1 ATP synthase subunit A [Ancylobacter mangrovi]MCS0503026.1 F0F1 ATP synthase subunit A [Ancylobacter mangrovi]